MPMTREEWDRLVNTDPAEVVDLLPDGDELPEETEESDQCEECARSYGPHYRGRCTH